MNVKAKEVRISYPLTEILVPQAFDMLASTYRTLDIKMDQQRRGKSSGTVGIARYHFRDVMFELFTKYINSPSVMFGLVSDVSSSFVARESWNIEKVEISSIAILNEKVPS